MNLLWVLIIVLVVLALVGAPGVGPWANGFGGYGWRGSGAGFIIVVILVVLLLSGRL
jgi:hypothetical protein